MGQHTAQPAVVTGGLDVSDRYTYVCILNAAGELVDKGRVATTPEALRRRFGDLAPMRLVLEAGTHSPWISRLLEEGGHEVLVANRARARPRQAACRDSSCEWCARRRSTADADLRLSISNSSGRTHAQRNSRLVVGRPHRSARHGAAHRQGRRGRLRGSYGVLRRVSRAATEADWMRSGEHRSLGASISLLGGAVLSGQGIAGRLRDGFGLRFWPFGTPFCTRGAS
jgi:hypothetical protein